MTIYYDSISEALGIRHIRELVPDYIEDDTIPNDAKLDMAGARNPFFGMTHTEETKQSLRAKRKGKNTFLDKNGNYVYGDVQKIDYINYFPRQFGKVFVKDTHGNKFQVLKNDHRFKNGEISGLNKGKSGLADHLNAKTFSCVHCGFVSTKGNIVRWHNDKCKEKPNE